MAIRIQLRRDTAANWVSSNPVLRQGEIGIETDTLKMKLGNGSSTWTQITAYMNIVPDGNLTIGDYVLVTDIGAVDGVVGLDNSKNALIPGSSIIVEGSTDNSFETTLTVINPTADRTITFKNADGTVAFTSDIPSSTDSLSEGSTNKYFTDERAQDAVATALAAGTHTNISVSYNDAGNAISLTGAQTYNDENAQDAIGNNLGTGLSYNDTTGAISVDTSTIQARVANVTDTEIGYLDGVTSAIQTQIDTKAPLASPTLTGTPTAPTAAAATNTTQVATTAFVRGEVTALVNGASAALDTLGELAAALTADEATAATLATLVGTKAPIASPTFTGTVSGITKSMVGLGNVDNTTDAAKPISTLTQTALDLKAPLASPTFTGTVSGITNTMVGLGNVDNTTDAGKPVSTATQTALDLKAPLASPTLTGTPTAPTAAAATNTTQVATTAFVRGEVTALVNGASAALDTLGELAAALTADEATAATLATLVGTKAPIASPTFTGTVSGITKSMVGLGNVDNTTDAGKPVSTATQTALDLKAPLLSPTFTGTVVLPLGTVTSSMILDGTILDADINASAAIALSKLATDPLARANHTGSQTASTILDFNEAAQDAVGAILGSGLTYTDASNTITVDSSVIQLRVSGVTDTEIGYLDGVTSAIQTQLGDKAPLSSPTFTGTVSAADLTLSGNLTVNGTTTNLNTTNLVIEDKNIVLGDTATPTDITANGGGITLNGATNKTFNWVSGTSAWTSSENLDLASGKVLKIAGTEVLSTTTYTGKAATAGNADTATNGVVTTGTYSNPSWITGLAWSKISSTPTTLSGYGITDALASSTAASTYLTQSNAASTYAPIASPTFTGTVSGITKTMVGLGNVENTALSTWAGSSSITTLGTIATGVWSGTAIATTNGGTGLTSYTTGDLLYSSATNTLSKLAAGTDGYILTLASGVPSWAAAPITLPSQTGNSGKYLTTNGTSASWGTLVVPITTGTATVSANTATTVDTTALSAFTSIEYMVSLKQGSKVRTSKVVVQTDGTSVDMTEFAITETGGTIAGVVVSATTASTNGVLQLTVTDAATTNVTVKFSKVAL